MKKVLHFGSGIVPQVKSCVASTKTRTVPVFSSERKRIFSTIESSTSFSADNVYAAFKAISRKK